MSRTTDYRTLINRGRKAGLNTRELYSAMAAAPADSNEPSPGQTDGNGFVASVNQLGHREYHPVDSPRP